MREDNRDFDRAHTPRMATDHGPTQTTIEAALPMLVGASAGSIPTRWPGC
jgi:hypothetical protein